MSLAIDIRDRSQKKEISSYLLRLPGWTQEQYLREAPEMQFCEFERGELVMHSPVTAEHQSLVRFLSTLLTFFCSDKDAGMVLTGPAAIPTVEGVIREPDIFVVSPEDIPKATGLPVMVVPIFVIEVISPATRILDLQTKRGEYAEIGVSEYWVVDHERGELTAHREASPDGYQWRQVFSQGRLECSAIPGFWIDVAWLWRKPLPRETECMTEIQGG